MSNLEELKEAESNLQKAIESLEIIDNASLLNVLVSTYLPSIAKSLAIIADKMSEKDKEDQMEHIVQFGVSIDDSAIQRRVEDSCVEAVKKEMMSCFFDNYSNPKFHTEEIIKDWLDNHKDEVIQRAAEVIAEKMYKSTKVRQSIIEKCGEEVNG